MNFFAGAGHDMGRVSRLPADSFSDLCALLAVPERLPLTRGEFFALPRKDRGAPNDQARAKRVHYLTPSEFKTSPAQRITEHVVRCNLLCLDVDDAKEAQRLLAQKWEDCLGSLAYVVWRTASSTPGEPRLRVVVAANGLTPDKYVAAARTIAEMVGLTQINSQVTFHCVQPMFVPTVFADTPEGETPIVASNPDGDLFSAQDILAEVVSNYSEEPGTPTSQDQVADLAYLRAPMEGITLEDARDALAHLDPDMGMQQWIEVAAGLKHQFPGEGYALWDDWSAKGKKYVDNEETTYRWSTLKSQPIDRAPVTIRSLFKSAQARGWSNPALTRKHHTETLGWLKHTSRSAEELLDQGAARIAKIGPVLGALERKTLVVALHDRLGALGLKVGLPDLTKEIRQIERDAARTTGIPSWAKGLCYVTSGNFFYRHATDRKFLPEVLDLMYTTPPIGEDRPMRPRDYVIQIAGCAQVEAQRYDPARGEKRFFSELSVPYVNTYRADHASADPSRADEAGEIVEDHIAKLISDPSHRHTMLSFLAYQVQYPGKKVRWAPLIQSGEGAGKTAIHAMMVAALGRRNTKKLSGADVMNGAWNEWAEGRQFVTLEEVRIIGANRHAVMDKMKPLITDDEISLARKFADQRTALNVTNYVLFTNYQDALAIHEDGRRYFVIQSPIQNPTHVEKMGGKAHFTRLYQMIRDNPGGLRAWFEGYKIAKDFDPEGRAPRTIYLAKFADNASSALAATVRECIEDQPHPLVRQDLLSLACLRGCMPSANLPHFTDQALSAVLRELGWEKVGRPIVDGARHTLYSKGLLASPTMTANARASWL